MDIKKLGSTASVYTYDDIESYVTNVFLIEKKSRFYIIDTYCGPDSIAPVLDIVNNNPLNKEIMVINTHFHWDHVWGNCSFKGSKIIGHELCRQALDKSWDMQITQNRDYIFGKVEKVLPNTTFKDKIIFHDDGIELFHSPGHTADSISIFDHEEKILYAGDNLEKPIIYVENTDITAYIGTLKNYLAYKPDHIAAGHTLNLTAEDILDTIRYLEGLLSGEKMHFESQYAQKIHAQNLSMIQKP